jgi:glyoxylase I family protein
MKINGFHHVAVNTADFNGTERFYTQLLGLKKVRAWGGDGRRCAMYACADGSCIELFEVEKGVETPDSPIVHFAFDTDDPDAFAKIVEDAGFEITTPPKTAVVAGTPGFTARLAFCKGPNGEIIEFFSMKG